MNMLVLSLLAMGSPATGSPDSSSVDELRAMVTDLQKQVDTLKSQTDENWLTQQRADQIKGLVQDVLADADTRASLLQGGAMAGCQSRLAMLARELTARGQPVQGENQQECREHDKRRETLDRQHVRALSPDAGLASPLTFGNEYL